MGVLFLDELPEFRRDVLEALRQPLEDGRVLISRARSSIELPCRFQLIVAANPCPCGHGPSSQECECPEPAVRRYSAKLTGALADRIDLCLRLAQPSRAALSGARGPASKQVRDRVLAARERQAARLGPGRTNARMAPEQTRELAALEPAAWALLRDETAAAKLSGRGFDRLIRVARTLADLEERETVSAENVHAAMMLRAANA